MTVPNSYKVELIYFKKSGKYYSEGSYTTHRDYLFEIWAEVITKLQNGDWPGLIPGKHDFYILVNVPGHPNEHPHLIIQKTLDEF